MQSALKQTTTSFGGHGLAHKHDLRVTSVALDCYFPETGCMCKLWGQTHIGVTNTFYKVYNFGHASFKMPNQMSFYETDH